VAVIERRGRLLICRRPRSAVLGGFWEFPGGKRLAGESWTACLRRELREELGVTVGPLRPFGELRYRYPSRTIMFKVFRCAIRRGVPRALAASRLRWVRPADLGRYRFPPANDALLRRLSAARPTP
jgi:mutator protein MutT